MIAVCGFADQNSTLLPEMLTKHHLDVAKQAHLAGANQNHG
jgi:hypothetical protein